MSKFTEELWSDLVREHGPALVQAERPRPEPFRLRRPEVLAGGTLGLAGIGAALVVALSAGGATASPAFAVTRQSDGTLTINLADPDRGLMGTNDMLAAKGYDEHIMFTMGQGAAPAAGIVGCQASPRGASVPGPALDVTVGPGDSNTETIPSGNTGAGTWHVVSCERYSGDDTDQLKVHDEPASAVVPGAVAPRTARRDSRSARHR